MSLFNTAVEDVFALVPEASPARLAEVGIGEEIITGWIDELSARVALRCRGWQRLSTTRRTETITTYDAFGVPTVATSTSPAVREQFAEFARTVVANGAASYVEASRHPERAAVSDSSYQDVLWRRFTEGLEELVKWLEAALEDDDLDADGDPIAPAPRGWFPPPSVTSCTRW